MYSKDIDKNNPFSVSKFEKKLKSLCFTIKDETLRKYILEGFLNKIRVLTPIQSLKKRFNRYKKKDYKILDETKELYNRKTIFQENK